MYTRTSTVCVVLSTHATRQGVYVQYLENHVETTGKTASKSLATQVNECFALWKKECFLKYVNEASVSEHATIPTPVRRKTSTTAENCLYLGFEGSSSLIRF